MSSIFALQSIQTRYLPPTNSRGSRIKATTASGLSTSIPYPHELSGADCHAAAVKALLVKHGFHWADRWAVGASIDGRGYVFVPVRHDNNFVSFEG